MGEENILFKEVKHNVQGLVNFIDIGYIGLPELQRPFVWPTKNVRDLFDSMYKGYPVGNLVFWDFSKNGGGKSIGVGNKTYLIPRLLIIDGQQRLTSLYAVLKDKLVIDKNYREKKLEIAFRPMDSKFEVCDAAIRRDPEFIPDISEIWSSGSSSRKIVNEFLKQLKAKKEISEDEEETISHNIDRLLDLNSYPFTAIEIASTVDEEQAATIFVRLNSKGTKLKQADFIMTLMSVYANDLREELESFCKEAQTPTGPLVGQSPFNHFIQPTPDQLVRVAAAIGFYRGRLRNVYQILHGKDIETDKFSGKKRDEQFEQLRLSQGHVLDLTLWHQFFNALMEGGFRSGATVSSSITILYAYAFYLIGKTRYNIPYNELDSLISRWFYAVHLSGRYTVGAPETMMDTDLRRVKDLSDGDGFKKVLEQMMEDTLTNDFWKIGLPNELETSSATNRGFFTYYAALNKLNAPVLFSRKSIKDLLDPSVKRKKKAIERHHLFPRGWLKKQGIEDIKQVNQGANYALLEWPDNIDIKDTPPAKYVPNIKPRFTEEAWQRMCRVHALPAGWETLPYDEFLRQRRALIAQIIKEGFESLSGGPVV